jgi:hypothetical protein
MRYRLRNMFWRLNETQFAGVYSGEATPDPIPNSEVKLASGDGSAVVTPWESSTMPAFYFTRSSRDDLKFCKPE